MCYLKLLEALVQSAQVPIVLSGRNRILSKRLPT